MDKSNKIKIGSRVYFQLGFNSIIPNDGKSYAITRLDGATTAKLVKIAESSVAVDAYTKDETATLLSNKQNTL